MAVVGEPGILAEQILEIRFRPDARVIDRRGALATAISAQLGLPHWQLIENRVDLWNEDEDTRAFVGFRNMGFILRRYSLPGNFIDHANNFVRYVLSQQPFGAVPLLVERLGVRVRFAMPVRAPFASLVDRYQQRVFPVQPAYRSLFGGVLTDIGAPLYFKTELGKLHTHGGPMEKWQIRNFFDYVKEDRLPDVALYTDLDYSTVPAEPLTTERVTALVRRYTQANHELYDSIVRTVLHD